MKKVQ